jgi:hypothetical protein
VDGTGAPPRREVTVVVELGRIAAVTPAFVTPAGVEVIDLSGVDAGSALERNLSTKRRPRAPGRQAHERGDPPPPAVRDEPSRQPDPVGPSWRFGERMARRIEHPLLSVIGGNSNALWARFGEVHRLLLKCGFRASRPIPSPARRTSYRSRSPPRWLRPWQRSSIGILRGFLALGRGLRVPPLRFDGLNISGQVGLGHTGPDTRAGPVLYACNFDDVTVAVYCDRTKCLDRKGIRNSELAHICLQYIVDDSARRAVAAV